MKKKNEKLNVLDSLKLRSTFDLQPSAQNATSCAGQSRSEVLLQENLIKVNNALGLAPLDKAVMLLSLNYGLRISEIIRCDKSCLLPGRKVMFRGLKNSYNRIIDEFQFYDIFVGHIQKWGKIELIFSRFYYYRLFLKCGVSVSIEGNNKRSVTHAGRHLQSRMLQESGIEIEENKRYIGHKSIKSTEKYAGKKIN